MLTRAAVAAASVAAAAAALAATPPRLATSEAATDAPRARRDVSPAEPWMLPSSPPSHALSVALCSVLAGVSRFITNTLNSVQLLGQVDALRAAIDDRSGRVRWALPFRLLPRPFPQSFDKTDKSKLCRV
jgi:hypothetical protein